jgi:4-amino-4-deoxy-L-arabinose transferase-like glycosyltransferase
MQSRKLVLAIWLLLVAIRLTLGLWFIRANSLTGDETLYITAGYIAVHDGDFSVNAGHPPLAKLMAGAAASLVWDPPYTAHTPNWRGGVFQPYAEFFYADRVFATLGERGELVAMVARLPGMLLGIGLCLLCGLWAHRLWGPAAGVLALGVAVFDPSLLAHSAVVGTDAPLACFLTLAVYLAWEHARRPSRRLLCAVGVAFGLALATKFSAATLGPIIAVLIGFACRTPTAGFWTWLRRLVISGAVALGLAVATLVASYGVIGVGQWLTGMGTLAYHQSAGHPAFLLGEISTSGWWYYFPVAVLAKTPALTLILILAGLGLWRFRRDRRWLDTVALLGSAALFFAVNLFVSVNIGIRYLLPIYPFLIVAAAHLVHFAPARARAAAVAGALGGLAATTVPYAPHQLAYFSHFVGGPDHGAEWLSDSNIDWGQDLRGLADWMHERNIPSIYLSYYGRFPPSYYGFQFWVLPMFVRPPVEPMDRVVGGPLPRYLAVSVTNLHGTYMGKPHLYDWLKPYQPVAKIGYSIFVYDTNAIPDAQRQIVALFPPQPAEPPPANKPATGGAP